MEHDPSPLEQIRRRLALAVGENAAFDGWTSAAVDVAADSAGVERGIARLALRGTATDLIDAYVARVDETLAEGVDPLLLAQHNTGQRIRKLVLERLAIMGPAREAMRRALAILAMPQNLVLAARIGWRSVDGMWRLAGDRATDFNHYSKRATLLALYSATLLVWLDDRSEDWSETAAFLDRRLGEIGRFERAKARWRQSSAHRPSITRFLGRLRYPPPESRRPGIY